MSGAAARKWEYDYGEEDELEAEAQAQSGLRIQPYHADELDQETEFEEEYPIAQTSTAYAVPFTRQSRQYITQQVPPKAAFNYASYSQPYHETAQRRRPARFTPLDSVMGLAAVLPGRLVIGLIVGLVIGGLVISNGLSMLGADSSKTVYHFGNSSSVTVSKAPPATATGTNVLGSPTIEPAKIDAVLRQFNSPATGVGQAMYNLGVRYGIDPAYALAFFIHESSAGTQGVATVTKSIGNIRCTSGYECYQTSGNGSFRRYSSWEAGAEDWFKLIKEQYVNQWGLKTLEQILPVYAPSADRNNPTAYAQGVAQMVNGWRNGK